MEDRELLELAAKAAGVEFEKDCKSKWGLWLVYRDDPGEYARRYWNPLADDGDALRLVVKLQLELTAFRDHVTAFHATGWCDELNGGDPGAAARRAIVRAASEIGRAKP